MVDLIDIAKRMEHFLRNTQVNGVLDLYYDLDKGLKVSSYVKGFTKVTLEIPHDGVTAFLHNDIPSITGEIEEGHEIKITMAANLSPEMEGTIKQYKGLVCKGSVGLGTACGECDRCRGTRR